MLSERSLLVRLGYRESCSYGVRGRYGGSFSHDALFRGCLSGRRLRPLGRAHAGFLSGRLTSSNVGTCVLSNQDSNVAPQTLQDAWPVYGTKNFISVRLYSAPQSHWTIVAILEICAFGEPVQAGLFAAIKSDPLPDWGAQHGSNGKPLAPCGMHIGS